MDAGSKPVGQSRSRWRCLGRLLRRGAALGFLALSAGGCCSLREYVHNGFKVGPNYCRPAAPVAPDWIDAADVRAKPEPEDICRWWKVFNDPILDALVEDAARQNLTLKEAGFRVLRARAELGFVVGRFFPQQQSLAGDYARRAVSTAVANRQFTPERFYTQWDFGFYLNWELDFWGRFRRAIEAADADLDASVEQYDDVLVTLLGDVGVNYVQLRTLERELELVRQNVELQKQIVGIAESRFRGGLVSELDLDQAKSVLGQTEALIPQLEIDLRQANNRLCILLGIPPEDLRAKLGKRDIPVAPPQIGLAVPAEYLLRRPDVRRAEREAAAACARIGVAEADFYPSISINGNIGVSAEDFKDLFTNRAMFGVISPSFNWKILEYGRILNNVRMHDARFQEKVVSYQNTVLKAGQEAEDALVTFLKSHQKARRLAEAVEAATKAVSVAVAQYKGGLVDFNRVAVLARELVQQQDAEAQARGQIATGLVQLYKALGGGWQIRCGPPDGGPHAAVATAPVEELPAPRPAGKDSAP